MLEAVEASLCYFFKHRLMKLKFPNLLNPLWTVYDMQHHQWKMVSSIISGQFNSSDQYRYMNSFIRLKEKFLMFWMIRLVCMRYLYCPTQTLLKQLNSAYCVRMAVWLKKHRELWTCNKTYDGHNHTLDASVG